MTTTLNVAAETTPSANRKHAALGLAAAASAGAALVHAAAAGTHAGDNSVQALFAGCAVIQLGWAVLAVVRPSRPAVFAGAAFNALAVAAWVTSRTVGLPFPEGLTGVDEVGVQDALAAFLGLSAVAYAVVSISGRLRPAISPRWMAAGAASLILAAVPAMVADHHHDDGTGHTHNEDPVISLDDPRLTDEQRAAAQKLIDETRAAMARFPDLASVGAAGHGGSKEGLKPETVKAVAERGGGHVHLVNKAYLNDGREVDPGAIEFLVKLPTCRPRTVQDGGACSPSRATPAATWSWPRHLPTWTP